MKRERAFVEGRRKRIMEIMEEKPEIRVDELAQTLGVALITIRRDLRSLEEQKLLIRTYGGAIAAMSHRDAADEIQMYRTQIARCAASFVTEEDSLFINTSSNALEMLNYITCGNVTVITNNGKAVGCEYPQGINVVLTGGELRHPKDAMVGDFALRNLQPIYAKKAFMGCSGISAAGMTTGIFNEVSINEMMVDHATQNVYVLADHTKIGVNSSFVSCPMEKIKVLITDEKAPEEALELIRKKGVQVYQVSLNDASAIIKGPAD